MPRRGGRPFAGAEDPESGTPVQGEAGGVSNNP